MSFPSSDAEGKALGSTIPFDRATLVFLPKIAHLLCRGLHRPQLAQAQNKNADRIILCFQTHPRKDAWLSAATVLEGSNGADLKVINKLLGSGRQIFPPRGLVLFICLLMSAFLPKVAAMI